MDKEMEKVRDELVDKIIWERWQDDLAKFNPTASRDEVLSKLDYRSMVKAGWNAAREHMEPFIQVRGGPYKNRIAILLDELTKANEENSRLREALEFYADPSAWSCPKIEAPENIADATRKIIQVTQEVPTHVARAALESGHK